MVFYLLVALFLLGHFFLSVFVRSRRVLAVSYLLFFTSSLVFLIQAGWSWGIFLLMLLGLLPLVEKNPTKLAPLSALACFGVLGAIQLVSGLLQIDVPIWQSLASVVLVGLGLFLWNSRAPKTL
jgi:hypothetical protein